MCRDYFRIKHKNKKEDEDEHQQQQEEESRTMASVQPIVSASTSEFDDNIDEYFPPANKDEFTSQTFIYSDGQTTCKSKLPMAKSKPRKNKRSGKDFD